MISTIHALHGVLESMGLAALLILCYAWIQRASLPPTVRAVCLGLLFGLGAITGMAAPHQVAPGIFVDGRGVLLGLAAPFGGPVAGIVAGVLAGAYRLWAGGVGAWPGVAGVVIASGMGLLFHGVLQRGRPRLDNLELLALGGMVSSFTSSVFLLPSDMMEKMVYDVIPAVVVVTMAGTVVLGRFLSHENARLATEGMLRQEARSDPLTGLANRRHFEQAARRAVDAAEDNDRPLTVLAVDCDHFKAINDRHGHDVGDHVLMALAKVMTHCVRGDDLVARIGGEEFVVLLSNVGADTAAGLAERLRREVEQMVVPAPRGPVRVTVSIGMAERRPERADLTEMLRAADRALYCAKSKGRNRVVMAKGLGLCAAA
jgi:diguanylate cyclase